MATSKGQYATLAAVKLRLNDNDNVDDALLQSFCDQANQWLESKTGRVLAPVPTFATTLNANAAVGATSVTLATVTGLNPNDVLAFGPITGTHESASVYAINQITFVVTLATPLINAYANGAATQVVYVFDGFSSMESGKLLPVPLGFSVVQYVEVATFSAGQGGATTTNVTWYQQPGTDFLLRPAPQLRSPGWPATELWITNVPVPSNTVPSFFPGYNNVRVWGNAGWPAIPDDAVDICSNVAIGLYRARSSTGGDIVHIGTDGSNVINRSLSYENRQSVSRYSRHDLFII